jgi:hypothetical protein
MNPGKTPVIQGVLITCVLLLTACGGSGVTSTTDSGSPGNGKPTLVSFTASPANIGPGSTSTLSWNVTNSDTVNILPDIGNVSASGQRTVTPPATRTYTLTATNSAGTISAQATVTVATQQTGRPNGWLYTKPNNSKIYVNDGAGEKVWMGRGGNMDDLFQCGYNNTLWMTNPSAEQAMKTMVSGLMQNWKPNFVRVSLGMSSYTSVSWLANASVYRTPMENVINTLGSYPNVYVLVTLRSDATMSLCDTNDAICLSTNATDPLYAALVDSFKDKPFVMFGLSNEPGGMSASDETIRAAMNHAVDVIRAREDALGVPHHIVAIQGNQWTSRIGFYNTAPLAQDNLVYEYHSYPPVATGTYGYTYANIPVIIGEYGNLSQSQADTLYADLEAKQIPNLAWDFSPFSNCAPDLLQVTHSATSLVPTSWGSIVQSYLLSHAQ